VHRIRRMPLVIFPLLLALAIAGCASKKQPEEPRGALTRIVERGVIQVGMTGEQPPLTMLSKDGEFLGLDVALMRVLARNMGVEAKFVQLPFGQLLPALEAGQVDVVMSGMTITPARVARVAFVGPYFTSGKSILTRSEALATVAIAEELNRSDLRLAALEGSTSEDFVRATLPKATLVKTESLDEAVRKVIDGEVDALIADRETCSFAVLRNPDQGLIASEQSFTIEPMGIAVPLDQPRLANLIRVYLTALDERGAIEKARAFWFEDPSWVGSLR
jgi:polar amino acid transport system substrate-binding protein